MKSILVAAVVAAMLSGCYVIGGGGGGVPRGQPMVTPCGTIGPGQSVTCACKTVNGKRVCERVQ